MSFNVGDMVKIDAGNLGYKNGVVTSIVGEEEACYVCWEGVNIAEYCTFYCLRLAKKRTFDVKTTERGWQEHYRNHHKTLFSRNTLVEAGVISVVVSSVGDQRNSAGCLCFLDGYKEHYETHVFHSKHNLNHAYADLQNQISINASHVLRQTMKNEDNIYNLANEMHNNNVEEVCRMIRKGEIKSIGFQQEREREKIKENNLCELDLEQLKRINSILDEEKGE